MHLGCTQYIAIIMVVVRIQVRLCRSQLQSCLYESPGDTFDGPRQSLVSGGHPVIMVSVKHSTEGSVYSSLQSMTM